MISRRFVLGAFGAGVAGPVLANAPLTSERPVPRPGSAPPPPPPPVASVEDILAKANLGGVTAFALTRLDGTIVEAREEATLLPPASVAKAITALYGLDHLGPQYGFRTRILSTGPIIDGVVQGDLILQGEGDPIFDTDALGAMIEDLADQGVTGITGRFVVDGTSVPNLDLIDPGQPPQVGYNPGISGLNLNFNRVHFEWKRAGGSYNVTMDARAKRFVPAVRSSRMRIADRATPIYSYQAEDAYEDWSVARGALGNGGARWLPVRKPALYAGDVFRVLARGQGISVPAAEEGVAPERTLTLVARRSANLGPLLGGMLRFSTNLTAEIIGLTSTQARGGATGDLAQSAAEMSGWVKTRFGADMALVDHSGLGDASRVTAVALCQIMAGAARDDLFPQRLRTYKLKDEDGAPIEDSPVGIRAKTGSLNFVSTFAGYLDLPEQEPLCFAILSADLPRRAALTVEDRESPSGGRNWAKRSRVLQNDLLTRWSQVAGA